MATDPRELERMRAIGHPARWRVLEVLWSGRELTATQAAQIAGATPSAMSYHLRHLARLGMVERVVSPDGRERPWRATSAGREMTTQPGAAEGTAMMRNLVASVSRAIALPPPPPGDDRPWPASWSRAALRLTREEARELHRRIRGLIDEFEERTAAPEPEDADVPADAVDGGGREEAPRRFGYETFWILGAQPPAGD
ncbi:ArsR/SmtB family transcription factor [Schaalia naturae]|uniref:ArsR/SmtB family transcription factor n=1 Tax=Schaalia naturae TaxID=635203 RepID=A0ABW2SRQ8_9ACTO